MRKVLNKPVKQGAYICWGDYLVMSTKHNYETSC